MVLLGIVMILYGAFTIGIAIIRLPAIWKMGKIQAFVKKLGETGTRIFFIIWGGAALGFGIFFLASNLPG